MVGTRERNSEPQPSGHGMANKRPKRGKTEICTLFLAGMLALAAPAAATAEAIQGTPAPTDGTFWPVYSVADTAPLDHLAPYRSEKSQAVDTVTKPSVMAANANVRWYAATIRGAGSQAANPAAHVTVKVGNPSGTGSMLLAFAIALFTISASGVMLMWKQVAQPQRSDRPGWEKWQR
ncbi:MAG: hypothetical protein AAGL24_04975 [Pseudomonadota bacterium]